MTRCKICNTKIVDDKDTDTCTKCGIVVCLDCIEPDKFGHNQCVSCYRRSFDAEHEYPYFTSDYESIDDIDDECCANGMLEFDVVEEAG